MLRLENLFVMRSKRQTLFWKLNTEKKNLFPPCLLLTQIAAARIKEILNSLYSPANIKINTHVKIMKIRKRMFIIKLRKILIQIRPNVSFSFFFLM